jgi:tetrahydromethanopterin S-methyltransferase subunit B
MRDSITQDHPGEFSDKRFPLLAKRKGGGATRGIMKTFFYVLGLMTGMSLMSIFHFYVLVKFRIKRTSDSGRSGKGFYYVP